MVGYLSQLVVWNPLYMDPSDGVCSRFDLTALCGCHTSKVCLFVTVCGSGLLRGHSLPGRVLMFMGQSEAGRTDAGLLCN